MVRGRNRWLMDGHSPGQMVSSGNLTRLSEDERFLEMGGTEKTSGLGDPPF